MMDTLLYTTWVRISVMLSHDAMSRNTNADTTTETHECSETPQRHMNAVRHHSETCMQ